MLEIAVCSLIVLVDYPQTLKNANFWGQGNLNLVSEKSGKSQGILLSIICGNPENACKVYMHAVVAAFRIYAQHGEDATKKGGWRPCIK